MKRLLGLFGREKLLKCPRCGISMKKLKKNGVVIDVCLSCNGMWLDDKEIDKLAKIGVKR